MQSNSFLILIHRAIEKCLDDPDLNVQKLTRIIGMSRTDIHRKIKRNTGLSATAYIRKVRLDKASELLKKNPATPVVDIAFKTGFSDQSYFTKRFKEVFGVCPLEYRRQSGLSKSGKRP